MAGDDKPDKGNVKETVGWATGDRRVEAEGKVEASAGDDASETDVEEAEEEVRRQHRDVVD